MKALTAVVMALLGVVLLAGSASPAAVKQRAYRHYVACGLSSQAKPAHSCLKRQKKGAFFRSNKTDIFYSVCVKFPTKKHLCAPGQEAEQGRLYVNKITSNIPGKHRVTWFVRGKRVGAFSFVVSEGGGKSKQKRAQKRGSRK